MFSKNFCMYNIIMSNEHTCNYELLSASDIVMSSLLEFGMHCYRLSCELNAVRCAEISLRTTPD